MIFKEFGKITNHTIILLHGGGLSWWMWKHQIEVLSKDYFVVTPILDGHGDDFETNFESIEISAQKVINYIKNSDKGRVYAIGGLSIGAQIVVEILSREPEITDFAIIESALVYPIKTITAFTVPMFNFFYGLIKYKWYARLQTKTLNVPMELFDLYFKDSSRMSKKTLINFTISNGNYAMPQNLVNSKAKTLIMVGGKELSIMKKSANLLSCTLKNNSLKFISNCSHGEISIIDSIKYIDIINQHFENYKNE